MELTFGRWQWNHLVRAWSVYWAGLAAVTLAPLAKVVWGFYRLPPGQASVSAGFNEGVLHVSALERGVTVWTQTAHAAPLSLWIAGPPLILWLAWLRARASQGRPTALASAGVAGASRAPGVRSGLDPALLRPATPPGGPIRADRRTRQPVDRADDRAR